MDQELEEYRQKSATPFNGATLATSDYIPLSELRSVLLSMLPILKEYFSEGIRKLDDWHEHDGYITTSSDATWNELDLACISEEALYASRPGDTYVRRAYTDRSYKFLLRYSVMDKDEDPQQYPGIWGDFDLTGDSKLVEKVHAILASFCGKLVVKNAKEYFDKNYAG